MTKEGESGLITYKQDILDIYNRIVKKALRREDEASMMQYSPFDRYLVEVPSTGELKFFTRTKKWGDKLNKISGIFVHGENCTEKTVLSPSELNQPIAGFVPDAYEFWSEGFTNYYIILSKGMGRNNIRRPNKKQLEVQIANG